MIVTFRRRKRLETVEAWRAALETQWKRRLAGKARQLWRERLQSADLSQLQPELLSVALRLKREHC